MSTAEEMSLDELSSIMNLQRQEAFDDATETLHTTMSRRGTLVLRSSGSKKESKEENAEEKLLSIIMSQQTSSSARPNRSQSSTRRRLSESELPAPAAEKSQPRRSSSIARGSSARKTKDTTLHSSYGNLNETAGRPKGQSSRTTKSKREDFAKSMSVGNLGNDTRLERRMSTSSNSDDGRRRMGSKSTSQMNLTSTSDVRRARRPSNRVSSGEGNHRTSTDPRGSPTPEHLKSRRESLRDQQGRRISEGQVPPRAKRVGSDVEDVANFDQLWNSDNSPTSPNEYDRRGIPRPPMSGGSGTNSTFRNQLNNVPNMAAKNESVDADLRSLGTTQTKDTLSTGGSKESKDGRPKKTKLEKIHELQAKCDRYKIEWIETTKDKKVLRQEVQDGKAEILSLTKEVELHTAETAILQKKLTETLQKLDDLQDEQRKERTDFSNTAKELAQSRIEFTKALNDARELRMELDKLEETLRTKDRRITDLEDDLKESKVRAEDLDSDLNFAEETVLKLEKEMKRIEEELIQYRAAADKDAAGDVDNMRKVRDDMEKRLFEDRERRLEEKQHKLEEKIRQFEEERDRFLAKEKEREEEAVHQLRLEAETRKVRDEERWRLDGDINERLQALEDDNTALQGRLKSEQLDSNVKLRQKEELIESLRKELSAVQAQLADLGSDPNGAASMKREVEAAKSEASTFKDELVEIQKHNGMLTEEIEELQSGARELKAQMTTLHHELTAAKKETEIWRRKATEWESKSGEWTGTAHHWKQKAEHWEKVAKEADPAASEESGTTPDPQALFLQAALDRKRAMQSAHLPGSKWNVIGSFLAGRSVSEESTETVERVHELEAENAKQAEIIKSLRSEMMKIQTTYKDQAYNMQQKIQDLIKERDAVEIKNDNLMKELELARKLESFAAQDME